MIYIAVLFLVLIILIQKIRNINGYWERRGVKQYSQSPLNGNFGAVIFQRLSSVDYFEKIYNAFPNERYFGIYQFLTPMLVIRDIDLIKKITVKDFDIFPEHATIVPEDTDPLFARNILFMKGGQKWQRLRSLLSPAFTSFKLKTMYPLMVECAKQLVNHYESGDATISLEMKELFSKYTTDVIGTTAFGIECDTFKNPDNIFYKMGKDSIATRLTSAIKMLGFNVIPSLMQLLRVTFLPKHVSEFFSTVVKDTMQLRMDKNLKRPDVIHLLLEARKGRLDEDSGIANIPEKVSFSDVSDEDLIAQAVIFFLAGFDTSSTALAFTSYELAMNQGVQQKLQDEIDAVLGEGDDFVDYDTLIGMKYMDMVITETLRMWPPITFIDRRAVKPFEFEPELPGQDAIRFDSGTVCLIPVNAIHMDPEHYPNPRKFDPERFSGDSKQSTASFTYLPFGAGPKGCIGTRFALLQAKLVLFAILSKFDIVTVPETQIPVTRKRGLFLGAERGVWLGLKKRNT